MACMPQKRLFTEGRGAANYFLMPCKDTHSVPMQALTAMTCVPVTPCGQVTISLAGAADALPLSDRDQGVPPSGSLILTQSDPFFCNNPLKERTLCEGLRVPSDGCVTVTVLGSSQWAQRDPRICMRGTRILVRVLSLAST